MGKIIRPEMPINNDFRGIPKKEPKRQKLHLSKYN